MHPLALPFVCTLLLCAPYSLTARCVHPSTVSRHFVRPVAHGSLCAPQPGAYCVQPVSVCTLAHVCAPERTADWMLVALASARNVVLAARASFLVCAVELMAFCVHRSTQQAVCTLAEGILHAP